MKLGEGAHRPGKSSVLVALFRLVEPCGGRVLVDGVDTRDVGLRALRRALANIPQEAVLVEGTGGENLDPFGEHAADALDASLKQVGLSPALREQQVGAGGERLSVGERQLLAIARVLLRASRLVFMDEPTAHIDPETDEKLQAVIRGAFGASSLLVIAHRLHTIADFDRVVVMDAGRAVEWARRRAARAVRRPLRGACRCARPERPRRARRARVRRAARAAAVPRKRPGHARRVEVDAKRVVRSTALAAAPPRAFFSCFSAADCTDPPPPRHCAPPRGLVPKNAVQRRADSSPSLNWCTRLAVFPSYTGGLLPRKRQDGEAETPGRICECRP